MFDPKSLLDQFLGGTNPDGTRKGASPDLLKGLAGGAAAGGLIGLLLSGKSPKKIAKTALKVGGTAALAGLAYKAYQNWQASKAPSDGGESSPMKDITPEPEGTPFLPAIPAYRDEMSLAILRAMISAAKADGHIDAAEQKKIFGKLDELNLDVEAKAWVMDELRKPLDIDSVVKAASSPEMAVEIYAASVLAIDPDDPAEQAYLAMLASRLKLDPGLRASIEEEARKAVA
ncbi:MAG: tellurite resistance TerB family protein [Alphaproteobacteria bacterium]|nr:tellurite resistance TerB family protein [Alphaproteobacteria bacterium]